jgi:hypothetical protein
MSDSGSVERNERMNRIALERAAQRNGGQNLPDLAPDRVVQTDLPVQAVDVPRRRTGTNEGGA